MSKDDILAMLSEFKKNNAQKYGITMLGLFGSYARGSNNDQSDIDICMKTATPDPFIIIHIKDDLEAVFKKHVDIIRVREKMNLFLKERIEKEAIYV